MALSRGRLLMPSLRPAELKVMARRHDRIKCKCGCENYLFVVDSEYCKNHKVIGIGKFGDDPEQLNGFLIPSGLIDFKKLEGGGTKA